MSIPLPPSSLEVPEIGDEASKFAFAWMSKHGSYFGGTEGVAEMLRAYAVHIEAYADDETFGHPMFHQLLYEIRDLHERKNRQYATQDDPLGNFRRTGQIIAKMLKPGLDPTLASCLAFMSKQVDGVYEMFGEGKTDCPDQLEDKLKDIVVYGLIGMILVRESNRR